MGKRGRGIGNLGKLTKVIKIGFGKNLKSYKER